MKRHTCARRSPVSLLSLPSRLSLVSLLWAAAVGCTPPAEPLIRDVRPTTLERGDTLLLELAPAACEPQGLEDGEEVRVRLGSLESEFAGRAVSSPGSACADRVLVAMGEAQEQALGGHRTFRGVVTIAPREGRVMHSAPIELDLFPRSLRRVAERGAALVDEWRAGRWLGLEASPAKGGLEVKAVQPGKAAARASLRSGDVITAVDGRAATKESLAAAVTGRGGTVRLSVTRDGRAGTSALPRSAPLPLGWIVAGLILFVVSGVIVLVAAIAGGFVTVWERKVAGRMQSRIGPNRVGPNGWLQWLSDALKLIVKEDIVPDSVDRPLFLLAPYVVFCGVFMTFLALPFSQLGIVADLNIGYLYIISITSLVVIGVIMGGWASNSKWSLLGGMRAAAQIISYEIPAGIALMTVAVVAGTLSPQAIIRQQGGSPWHWYVFHDPALFVAFFVYFIAALAEGNRTPFDLPEAESELVSGYATEYSGFRYGAFATAEWVNLWVIGAISTSLFFGGWRIPGVSVESIEASLWLQLASFVVFFVKGAAFVFVTIWLRWTLPRFRVDQMMSMCWKYFIPISVACLVGAALWVWAFVSSPRAQSVAEIAMFAVGGLGLAGYFLARVRYTFRATNATFDINLFR
jgi:NADH-quinone oxidoreductase subunit H